MIESTMTIDRVEVEGDIVIDFDNYELLYC